jgi:putative transposase
VRKSRVSEDQPIAILKKSEAGVGATELCRRNGIPRGCFYGCKRKYSRMEVSEAKRLRQLEENHQLSPVQARSCRSPTGQTSVAGVGRKTMHERAAAEAGGGNDAPGSDGLERWACELI